MSILGSTYVIDGVRQDLTPAQLASALMVEGADVSCPDGGDSRDMVDESFDAPLAELPSVTETCLLERMCACQDNSGIPSFPEVEGRLIVAQALIDAIRQAGRFKLHDLALTVDAKWHCGNLGEAASFYKLISSLCDYTDALGLQFSRFAASEAGGGEHLISIGTSLLPPAPTDIPDMYRSDSPEISPDAACPDVLVDDPSSWVVYVPFDTADFRLGGSALAKALGGEFDVAPQTGDADYFIDCFEVVRELVEDKIVLSARTVGRGGLLKSLNDFCGKHFSLDAELSDIVRTGSENSLLRVLYSEVPGILFQIKDLDFDYLDAELLLQEVVFYPLGHPVRSESLPGVRLKTTGKSGIQTILESLILNAEGED